MSMTVCLMVDGEVRHEAVWKKWLETGDDTNTGEVGIYVRNPEKSSKWVSERTIQCEGSAVEAILALAKAATGDVVVFGTEGCVPLKTLKEMDLRETRLGPVEIMDGVVTKATTAVALAKDDKETLMRSGKNFLDTPEDLFIASVVLSQRKSEDKRSIFYAVKDDETFKDIVGSSECSFAQPVDIDVDEWSSSIVSQEEEPSVKKRRTMWRPENWPLSKPQCSPFDHGWFLETHRRVLGKLLGDETTCVVELGSWYGSSTRWIAEHAPNAIVYAIDIWEEQHILRDDHYHRMRSMLQKHPLYDTFLRNLWDLRDHVVPLRMRTLDGLALLKQHHLQPDVIYIDADHHYAAVKADILAALEHFPSAILVGDDYGHYDDVKRAVCECAFHHGKRVYVDQNHCWTYANLPPADTARAFNPDPPSDSTFASLLAGYGT